MLVLHPHQIKRTYRRHTLPTTPVVPVTPLTDTEALDLVQKMHLNIFWEYADPISKLARERYFTDNPGFESNINYTEVRVLIDDNYMGVERGFVPRTEAVTRLTTAMDSC
jgi:hypothetical protein